MGQKLFEDKITNLSESGGTITLASGARLTIGGQQYVTSSALNVSADFSSPNTRYQIYAILNAGVVELVVSLNENSVGPAGASAWKLVGSYYSNGQNTIAFGSFVNIEGAPMTENWVQYDGVLSGIGTGTANFAGAWQQNGGEFIVAINSLFTSAGTGASIVVWPLPTGIAMNDVGVPAAGGSQVKGSGLTFNVQHSQAGTGFKTCAPTSALGGLILNSENAGGALVGTSMLNGAQTHINIRGTSTGFSNTPIKDL